MKTSIPLAFSALAYLAQSSHSKEHLLPELHHIGHSSCLCYPDTNVPRAVVQVSKRSHQGEIAVSPGDPSPSPPTSALSDQSNQTNVTSSQESSSWLPSTDTIVTAVFRAVITILSLLNANFTWRIHGKEIYEEHHLISTEQDYRHPRRPPMAPGKKTSASSSPARA